MTKQYRDQEDSISVFSVLTFPFRLILKLVWLILSSPVRFWRFLNRRPDPHVIGEKYERKICRNLKRHGFHHIYHTPPSGDHGVDIIAFKNGYSFAIQCKYYSYPVGNRAVQEVYTGCSFYGCDIPVVITNHVFTVQAKQEASRLDVLLWAKDEIPPVPSRYPLLTFLYRVWLGFLGVVLVFGAGFGGYFYWRTQNMRFISMGLLIMFFAGFALYLTRYVHRFPLFRKLNLPEAR